MSKLRIPGNVSRAFHKVGFQLKKHSPEILVTVGVIGTGVSAVMACKATLKANKVVEETKEKVNVVHEAVGKGYTVGGEAYSVEDSKKELAAIYAHTGLDLVKLYAPSVILGALSVTSILTSHNIIRKRNAALAAAYMAVDHSFKDYRGRVVERFGEKLDRELLYNIKTKEVEEKVVDETGEEKVVKKTVQYADPNSVNEFTRCFCEGCKGWDKNPENNLFFLTNVQNWANDKLRHQGFLFLNEVLKELGLPRGEAGQIVGWIYEPEKYGYGGDGYIDFGIYDLNDESKRDFVNGKETNIWLNFNVDGPIMNKIAAIDSKKLY